VERQAFIRALAAGAFVGAPRIVTAQQDAARRICILTAGVAPRVIPAAFRDELRARGWVGGPELRHLKARRRRELRTRATPGG
jgi:hypothetical protein